MSPRRDEHGVLLNAQQPGQRTWVGKRERGEPPVEDGRHIGCGSEVASAGGGQQVAERMFTRFGREGEQVGSQGRPGGSGGESWDVLVGLVELCDGLGSEELFGCDAEGVGVALDRLEEPGRWVVELAQHGVAETGASSLPRICCNVSVGVRGEMVSGRMTVCGSPSPTTWR
jgi:hypothetical protein